MRSVIDPSFWVPACGTIVVFALWFGAEYALERRRYLALVRPFARGAGDAHALADAGPGFEIFGRRLSNARFGFDDEHIVIAAPTRFGGPRLLWIPYTALRAIERRTLFGVASFGLRFGPRTLDAFTCGDTDAARALIARALDRTGLTVTDVQQSHIRRRPGAEAGNPARAAEM